VHSSPSKDKREVVSILLFRLGKERKANLGSSVHEEFVWFHPVGDHTSNPWEEVEDNRWFGGILWKLKKISKRGPRKGGIPVVR